MGPMILVVDTMSLVYRAHYTARPALQGFATQVRSLCAEFDVSDTFFAVDLPQRTFRHELSAGYKKRRRRTPDELATQFQRLDECLSELGGTKVAVAGFEADDVIATLCARLRRQGQAGVVATCDLDLVAMAYGGIEVVRMGQHKIGGERFDEAAVTRRFGVPPQLYAEFRAFKGDRSDGVPGVPGLHPRDAARVVREWGSAEAVLANLPKVKPPMLRRLLQDNAQRIRDNHALLSLREDVPIELPDQTG